MKSTKLMLLLFITAFTFASVKQAKAVAETEPNDLWNQANVLTLGATGTGAISPAGEIDWWSVNSPLDGKLTINFSSLNGQNIFCEIVDSLGTLVMSSVYTASSSVVQKDGLAAGTYYIKIRPYYGNGTPTYSFTPTWTTPTELIDVEPNGIKNQAKTLPLNGSKTGHVNFYYNNNRDTLDWWKVTTNKDGKLNWTLTSGNGQNVYAELFDNDGVTFLGGSYTSSTGYFSKDGLAVGTYYIRIRTYYATEFVPYTISNLLVLPPAVTDAEPNGRPYQALPINLNDSLVGHINYYYNHYRDTTDWYKVTTTLDGKLNFTMYSLNGQNVYLQLYDGDSTQYLGGTYTSSTYTWSVDGLAAGTYYFKINTYYSYEWAPYAFKLTQTLPPVTIDAEPNGTRALATTCNPNDSVVGHINYAYNHIRDTFDYRKITITSNGKISWSITSLNGQNVYARLYDNNALTYIAGNYTSSTGYFSADGLAPGTYYMIMNTYYGIEFVPYILKTTFTPAGNDPEPNGSYATAQALTLNDSLLGTVGYFYNGVRDTNDWFKITTPNDGQLTIKLYQLNNICTYLQVYDNNGVTQLFSQYNCGNLTTYSRNDLAKGTYYVRVVNYYNSHSTPYALVNSFVNNNPNDPEPNNYAKTSGKINGYSTKTGNINYYYDGSKDNADWWKMGYYALGTLDITVTKVQHTFDANYPDLLYRLYKDTTLAALDSVLITGNITLSYAHIYNGLTAGTYYIRITPLNNTFGGYSIRANYKDTTSQLVNRILTVADTGCGNGKINYLISRGKPPYSVQLYKDGIASGSPVVTSDTAKFTLLDAGYYSVITQSNSAVTSTVAGTDTAIAPKVSGLTTASLTAVSAITKWTGLPCVDGYKYQWRLQGAASWTTIMQPAGATEDTLTGLLAATKYQFRVYSYVVYNGVKYYSLASATKTFTTKVARLVNEFDASTADNSIAVSPNPASDFIQFELTKVSDKVMVTVTNAIGQIVKSIEINNAVDVNQSINISELKTGVYMLTVDANGTRQYARFVKE